MSRGNHCLLGSLWHGGPGDSKQAQRWDPTVRLPGLNPGPALAFAKLQLAFASPFSERREIIISVSELLQR